MYLRIWSDSSPQIGMCDGGETMTANERRLEVASNLATGCSGASAHRKQRFPTPPRNPLCLPRAQAEHRRASSTRPDNMRRLPSCLKRVTVRSGNLLSVVLAPMDARMWRRTAALPLLVQGLDSHPDSYSGFMFCAAAELVERTSVRRIISLGDFMSTTSAATPCCNGTGGC